MSRWTVAREQWVAWIEQGPAAQPPWTGSLHDVDARLADQLARRPFPTGDEETISRPELSGVLFNQPFESMTTMVRTTVDEPAEEEATRPVRPDPDRLEVGLRAPEDGLEVSLEPGEEATVIAPSPLTSPSADDAAAVDPPPVVPVPASTEHTVVAGAPSSPSVEHTVVAEAPSAPGAAEAEEDGLFIPALTRTVIQPPPAEPPPVEPPLAPPRVESSEPLPPAISGETVVGPPPTRPAEEPGLDSASASGSFTSELDPEDAAQTLTRGEIPYTDSDDPVPPRASKVVVGSGVGSMAGSVYDEEEPDDEATILEEEPQELDADDLVEESEEEPPPSGAEEATPPPAPRRARPTVEVGPPPPPVSAQHLEAAMVALPVAPAMDEDWQVDVFAEHFAALLPVQRPQVVGAEVEFIVHCAGLAPGAAVLDMGCGDGAHCVAMAARGLAVTGLDASPVQLMRASQHAQSMGLAVNLVAGDMRQPPVDGQFDAVVCLGGTLGLFGDEDDRLALQHMRDRLRPGGRLMLHVLNREYISGRLPARSWWQGQGCLVLDEAQMFAPTSRLHVHRTIVFETGTQFEHNIGLRVYGLTELVHMCAQVGLVVLEYSGSRHTRGRFYGATSSEIWLLAQRPQG